MAFLCKHQSECTDQGQWGYVGPCFQVKACYQVRQEDDITNQSGTTRESGKWKVYWDEAEIPVGSKESCGSRKTYSESCIDDGNPRWSRDGYRDIWVDWRTYGMLQKYQARVWNWQKITRKVEEWSRQGTEQSTECPLRYSCCLADETIEFLERDGKLCLQVVL